MTILSRYGIQWNGPENPISVPMKDGYWTPWHLADATIARLERDNARLERELADREARLARVATWLDGQCVVCGVEPGMPHAECPLEGWEPAR